MKIINLAYSIVLLFSLNSLPVKGGEYKLIYEDKQTGYSIADTSGACQAYENNLNRFKHIPYGMACGRNLDSELGFSRPNWERLDPMRYTELIREIYMTHKSKPEFIEDSTKWKKYVKDQVDAGKLTLEFTQLYIGRNKERVNFGRIGRNIPCDEVKSFNSFLWYGIEHIYRVDDDLIHLVNDRELGHGAGNLILYKNRVLTDRFYGDSAETKKLIKRDATLDLYEVDPTGIGLLCEYYYFGDSQPLPESQKQQSPK